MFLNEYLHRDLKKQQYLWSSPNLSFKFDRYLCIAPNLDRKLLISVTAGESKLDTIIPFC